MTLQRPFRTADLPEFEGRCVVMAESKVSGPWPLDELGGMLLGIGDVVDALVTSRVVGVQHVIDKHHGYLVRVHQLKPMIIAVVPSATQGRPEGTLTLAVPGSPSASFSGGGGDVR